MKLEAKKVLKKNKIESTMLTRRTRLPVKPGINVMRV